MSKNKQVLKFNLFGEDWVINYVDNVEQLIPDFYCFGDCSCINNTITIATKTMDNKPRSKYDIQVTLLHELVHCMLGSGKYFSCNDDEPLVEWLAKCLYLLINQKIIN